LIPNNIIQIHENYTRLGTFERVSVERWKLLNPDWHYQFIEGDQLVGHIKETWPEQFSQYCDFATIQKAAIQRIAAVHKYGGLYVDCDVYPIKMANTFTDLKSEANFYNLKDHSNYDGDLVADYIFAAKKGSKLLSRLGDEIFKRSLERTVEELNGWEGFIYETCSIHAFSEVAFGAKAKRQFIDGCDNHIEDLKASPMECNTYHYSTEGWVNNNRFERDGKDKQYDQLQHLDVIKEIYGV
jgi:hypothetical protein|tara:strand:- start:248 stop:970 length:723 start_codon:yes stop_codon:yes gene_type:complete